MKKPGTFKFLLIFSIFLQFVSFYCNGNTSTVDLLSGNFATGVKDSTPPNALGPADGSTTGLNPTIQWTSKQGATNYTLEISTNPDFSTPIAGSPFTIKAPNTSYTLDLSTLGGGTYYWRVKADTTTGGQYATGSFLALESVLYVYCASGNTCSDSGQDGTRNKPYQTISGAINKANQQGIPTIKIASRGAGFAYLEFINLIQGIDLKGGYDATFQESARNFVTHETILHPSGPTGLRAQFVYSSTMVEGVTIITDNISGTTYGVFASYSPGLVLKSTKITPGNSLSQGSYGVYVEYGGASFPGPIIQSSTISAGTGPTLSQGIYSLNSAPVINGSTVSATDSALTVAINLEYSNLIATGSTISTTGMVSTSKGISGIGSNITLNGNTINLDKPTLGVSASGSAGSTITVSLNGDRVTGTNCSGAATGISVANGDLTILQSTINSTCNTLGVLAESANIQKSKIYESIKLCSATLPVIATVTNNLIGGIYTGLEICNNNASDSFSIANNTIGLSKPTGTTGNGILVSGTSVTNALLEIKNNIFLNNGILANATGIFSTINRSFSSIDNNIFTDISYPLNLNNNLYTETCSSLDSPGSGTFGRQMFTVKTTANGLPSNSIQKVVVIGNNVYAGTVASGIGISIDGGQTFSSRTTANGLVSNFTKGLYVDGTNVYVGSGSSVGLSMSTDGGATFTVRNKVANGLGTYADVSIYSIFASGANIYASTNEGLYISSNSGTNFSAPFLFSPCTGMSNMIIGPTIFAPCGALSISTDGGVSYIQKTTADGLGGSASALFQSGSTLYVGTSTPATVSISNDGGTTFTVKGLNNGILGNSTLDIFVNGSTIYAATEQGLNVSLDGGNLFLLKNMGNGILYPNDIDFSAGKLYLATSGGVAINSSAIDVCNDLFSTPTSLNNKSGTQASRIHPSAVFNATFNAIDPATWAILANGPADLDNSGGWTTGDAGADASNTGAP